MPSSFFLVRRFLVALIGAALTGACSFQPAAPSQQEQIEMLDRFIRAGGYHATHEYQIESLNESWPHDGDVVNVSLTAPADTGTYPVILYLPGLGEPADAGRLWRENWAKAGYLVFSLQAQSISKALADLKPVADKENDTEAASDDQKARRRAQLLRKSDLRYTGHAFFSLQSLENRIKQSLWAYEQFKQKANAYQGLFGRADLSRIFIAGYDIGAQTTAALIGEQTGIEMPAIANFQPQAAILISPMVDPAMGNIDKRFQGIQIPFLVITSETDNDPYGISSPFVRTALWEYAPAGSKYLLLLKNAAHRLLAGSNWSVEHSFRHGQRHEDESMSDSTNQLQGDGSRRRNKGDGIRAGVASLRGADIEPYKSIAAIFSVSTAFLDSIAKSDNFADLWLMKHADSWIDNIAALKRKF